MVLKLQAFGELSSDLPMDDETHPVISWVEPFSNRLFASAE